MRLIFLAMTFIPADTWNTWKESYQTVERTLSEKGKEVPSSTLLEVLDFKCLLFHDNLLLPAGLSKFEDYHIKLV